MPLYRFVCSNCRTQSERLLRAGKQNDTIICGKPDCGGKLLRDYGAASQSTKIVEVIDTGLMPKRLERLADAERLFKERSQIPESKFRKF